MVISSRLPFGRALRSIALVAAVCGAAPPAARAQLPYATLHEFVEGPGGVKGRLIQAVDGHIYGTASEGGLYSGGVVFVMRRGPGGWLPPAILHDFHPAEGIKPLAGLTEGAPGILYGTTSEAGARGGGSLFGIAITGQFQVLHALNPGTDGAAIKAELTRVPNGSFYGVASGGGRYGLGTVFNMTASGVFTTLLAFSGPNGSQPDGAMALGFDGNLYGTTRLGGAYDYGTTFRLTRAGVLTTLYSFVPNPFPLPSPGFFGLPAALTLAWDGTFFGIAAGSPSNPFPVPGQGVVFRMTMAGEVTRVWEGLHESVPLTLASDGWLYGVVGAMQIYRIWPAPVTVEVGNVVGYDPFGPGVGVSGALLSATDGRLYAATQSESTFGHGAIVTVGSTGTLERVHAFRNDGFVPTGTLTKSPDGKLYGTTYFGGWKDTGTVFSVSESGAVSRLADLIGDYGGHYFGSLLELKSGDLVAVGRDHAIGVTKTGEATRWNTGGVNSGLVEAPDGFVYGSGIHDSPSGGIYRLGPDRWERIYIFEGPEGRAPIGGLVLGRDGHLYGTTSEGGAFGFGTVFRCTLNGTLTALHHFNGDDGSYPTATLVEGSDGMLYGTTLLGGDRTLVPEGAGTAFRISKEGNFTSLHTFSGGDGLLPFAGLSLGSDGLLYGTTVYGGLGTGAVFAIRPSEGAFAVLHRFGPGEGAHPLGGVTEANGALFGTTSAGGRPGVGVVYRLGSR